MVTAKKTRLWAYTLAVVILGFVHAATDMSSETGRGEQNETAAVCMNPHCIKSEPSETAEKCHCLLLSPSFVHNSLTVID